MYKIYCNEHQLVFAQEMPVVPGGWTLVTRYRGRPKSLFPIIDAMEKRHEGGQIWIQADDVEGLWNDFRQLFVTVEAAGGLVLNARGDLLVILRRGVLDLPKGKLEVGETMSQAACREVMEETGLLEVRCHEAVGETWHMFREKKTRLLKHTVWFRMEADQENLTPQGAEGISKAFWIPAQDYTRSGYPTFRNLRDMVMGALRKGSNAG